MSPLSRLSRLLLVASQADAGVAAVRAGLKTELHEEGTKRIVSVEVSPSFI